MDSVWCVNYNHEIHLFKEREDAEKFAFDIEYKYYKKRLAQEKKCPEFNTYSFFPATEKDIEFSLKLNERTEGYLDSLYNSDCSWQDKNKKLYKKGIVWDDNENPDFYVSIGSVVCSNDAPYVEIQCLPLH